MDEPHEGEDARVQQRLRSALSIALGLIALACCATIARELAFHVAAVIEAQQAAARIPSAGGPNTGPVLVANVSLDGLLILEAIVLEPLFLLAMGGLVAFVTRSSYALSIMAFIAYNLAALGFALFVWGLDAGWSPQHGLAAALACLIGLPIAEFGLWTLFRPGERARYVRS